MENKTYKKIEDVDEDDLINYRPFKIKSYNSGAIWVIIVNMLSSVPKWPLFNVLFNIS